MKGTRADGNNSRAGGKVSLESETFESEQRIYVSPVSIPFRSKHNSSANKAKLRASPKPDAPINISCGNPQLCVWRGGVIT